MAMTRKHYEMIAKAFAKEVADVKAEKMELHHREDLDETTRLNLVQRRISEIAGIRRVAVELSETFGKENPRFDKRRFLTACGVMLDQA